jgi:RHS repeat-associated protein
MRSIRIFWAVRTSHLNAGVGGPSSPQIADLPSYTDVVADWAGRTTLSQLVALGVTQAKGKVTTTYDGEKTSVKPAVGAATDSYTDVYGNTSKVVEHSELIAEQQLDTYSYDNDGRLTELREQAGQTAQSQCFTYDAQARLERALTTTAASCAGVEASDFKGAAPYQTGYTYDRLGNLQSVTDTNAAGQVTRRDHLYPGYDDAGTWTTANADQPHGIRKTNHIVGGTTTSSDTFTYNPDGTMLKRIEPGTGTTTAKTTDYTWTPLGRLATVTTTKSTGSQLTRYTYDADGNLLVRATPATTVAYLGGTELTTTDGKRVTATRYYSSGTATVAMRTTNSGTGKVTYLAADSQASTQLSIDADTGTTTRRRYTPFGDERSGSLPAGTDRGFLGKTEDTSTGLSLLGARAYDPALGRFLSPDPLSAPYEPQYLSAYTYSNNNPVNQSDPSGLFPVTDCMKGCRNGSTLYQDWMSPNGDGTWNYNSRTTSYNSAGDITGYHYTGKHYGTWGSNARLITPPQFFPFVAMLLPDFNALANIMSGDGTAEDWASVATDLPWLKGVKLIPDSVKEKGFKAVQDWLRKSGCTKCFLAGTEVLMSDGSTKDIEDVRVGDKVLATDPTTGKTKPREVTALIITEDDKHFNEISIATEHGIEQISPTHEHPFWSPSQKEWVEARNLKPGMTLLTDAGKTVIVTDNRPFRKQARTYNLTVADLHTYYVLAGKTPVLVHNSNCSPFTDGDIWDGSFDVGGQTVETMATVRVAGDTVHLDGLMVFPKGTQGLSRAPIGPDAIRQMKRSVAEQARSQGFSTVVLNYERHIPKPDGSIYKRPGSMTLDVAKILGD